MATLKLKHPAVKPAHPSRAPVRGHGSAKKPRPTLAQAQAERAQREAQSQARRESPPEQDTSARGGKPPAPGPRRESRPPRDENAQRRGSEQARGRGPGQAQPQDPRRGGSTGNPPRQRTGADARPDRPRRDAPPKARRSSDTLRVVRPEPAPLRKPGGVPMPSGPRPATLPRAAGVTPPPEWPDQPRAVGFGEEPRDGRIRLSKRMSELGLASRREADEWIVQGWVRVDGDVVNQLGARVRPEQAITIDARAHREQAQRVTILLHKPIGFVSGQAEDGHEPAVVLVKPGTHWNGDRVQHPWSFAQLRHLAPAGRLDIDSTGLLVLTQDGRIAKQLIGDDSPVEKEYLVRVKWTEAPAETDLSHSFPAERIALLRHGLELDGHKLRPSKVSWQNEQQLRFVLREGRKRQIRRMCELVGLEVIGLKRVRIGRVTLGELPLGQWRYLGPLERF
ncbi:MAG TPA: pseudouridine synthase [Burkholderiaceae bacterium]|nr:pseudouridine synthase [Burkholderiaceae bacterium]